MNFKIAINRSYQGKPPKMDYETSQAWYGEYNGRFHNVELTVDELHSEIMQGHGLTPQHRKYRHSKNFVCGQHIGLDFDTEDENSRIATLIQDNFIAQYAAILYTTPSHTEEAPRARVLFLLDRPIYDPEKYTELAAALLWRYGLADKSCSDPQRLFFGAGAGADSAISGNVLDLEAARDELITPFRAWQEINRLEQEERNKNRVVVAANEVKQSTLQKHSGSLLDRVRYAPDGEKWRTLRDIARTFGGYVESGYYNETAVIDWLETAIRQNSGNVQSLRAAQHTIKNGVAFGRLEPLDFTVKPEEETKSKYVEPDNSILAGLDWMFEAAYNQGKADAQKQLSQVAA